MPESAEAHLDPGGLYHGAGDLVVVAAAAPAQVVQGRGDVVAAEKRENLASVERLYSGNTVDSILATL